MGVWEDSGFGSEVDRIMEALTIWREGNDFVVAGTMVDPQGEMVVYGVSREGWLLAVSPSTGQTEVMNRTLWEALVRPDGWTPSPGGWTDDGERLVMSAWAS